MNVRRRELVAPDLRPFISVATVQLDHAIDRWANEIQPDQRLVRELQRKLAKKYRWGARFPFIDRIKEKVTGKEMAIYLGETEGSVSRYYNYGCTGEKLDAMLDWPKVKISNPSDSELVHSGVRYVTAWIEKVAIRRDNGRGGLEPLNYPSYFILDAAMAIELSDPWTFDELYTQLPDHIHRLIGPTQEDFTKLLNAFRLPYIWAIWQLVGLLENRTDARR